MTFFFALLFSLPAFAGEFPTCRAEMNDAVNNVVAREEWEKDMYVGSISDGVNPAVLISTSAGDNKIMSLWVREKTGGNPNGMFSFVDLSSGREQYLRFYMASGMSVGVTCSWRN